MWNVKGVEDLGDVVEGVEDLVLNSFQDMFTTRWCRTDYV